MRARLGESGANAKMKRLMIAHALNHSAVVEFRVSRDNVISRRAMEKIGGVLTDRLDVAVRGGVPVEHVIHEVTRDGFDNGPFAAKRLDDQASRQPQ